MLGGDYWALPTHNAESWTWDCGQSWLKSLLLCDCTRFCHRKMRPFSEGWWCSKLLFLHYLMKAQQSPPDTLNKCIRDKEWNFFMCSPRSTLDLQQEGCMHITVSCFSVLSSARFYALKTEMLRKGFDENTLLCSPTPSACTVRQAFYIPSQHSY